MPPRPKRHSLPSMSTDVAGGSYLVPRPEHARVSDAMRHELLSCPADATLRDAARLMCTKHVHMVVVSDPAGGPPVGVLTDAVLLDAMLDAQLAERPLAERASNDAPTISSDAPLRQAAERMREHNVAHLLVRDAHNGHPIGVLSTLDIAGILAWGEA